MPLSQRPNQHAARAICSAAAAHRTQCKEMAAEPQFRCDCDGGYALEGSPSGGGGRCVDFNECAEYPTLCDSGEETRNACKNTEGSYECERNVANACTGPERGGCWSATVRDVEVTSCMVRHMHVLVYCDFLSAQRVGRTASYLPVYSTLVLHVQDKFAEYKANLQKGQSGGALHVCDCESIEGCWEGGDGECTRKCPAGDCNPDTKQCGNGGGGSSGAASYHPCIYLHACTLCPGGAVLCRAVHCLGAVSKVQTCTLLGLAATPCR